MATAHVVEQRLAGLDRADWGEGPWQYEPDEYYAEFYGFGCWALRHPSYGNWCGYLEVPDGHPWYGRSYDAIRSTCDNYIAVHGGLTYAGDMPQVTDGYVVGFDCGHGLDYQPKMEARLRKASTLMGAQIEPLEKIERYRDLPYVLGELRTLARQARDAWVRD